METRMESRRREFKKNAGAADVRRRCEEETVQIRKKERDEQLQTRRRISDETPEFGLAKPTVDDLPSLARDLLNETDRDVVSRGLNGIRKLLASANDPPVEEVRAVPGVLPRLVQILKSDDHPDLQFEASWALTNIASGSSEDTAAVVALGALPVLVGQLGSADGKVREQAVWAIANISGDGAEFRDQCIAAGAVSLVSRIVQEFKTGAKFETAVWALSNLARGNPQPPVQTLLPCFPAVSFVLCSQGVPAATVADALYTLQYICDGPPDRAASVVEYGDGMLLRRAVSLLSHPNSVVQTPAIRVIGSMVTGSSEITAAVAQAGALPAVRNLFRSPKKQLRKEAVWIMSNFLADSPPMIDAVISLDFFPLFLEVARLNGDVELRREVSWCYCNAASAGRPDQLAWLWQRGGALDALVHLICVRDAKTVKTALEALRLIFDGSKISGNLLTVTLRFEELDGLSKLEDLQLDENDEIYASASALLCKFFETDETDETKENMLVSNPHKFNF